MTDGVRADWRPTAALSALRHRARMLACLRQFFASRGVLEVETPILSAGAVSDPNIESLMTRVAGLAHPFYLSTSPEFPMKRLLASGSGDIYQVSKVFRDAERGRWHNPEFTMIEWYRVGLDDAALMTEVEALAGEILAPHRRLERAERLTYAEALRRHAGVDAHLDGEAALERAAAVHGIVYRSERGPADGRPAVGRPADGRPAVRRPAELDRDAKLDLLMGMVVGPKLGRDRPCFVCDYPASQASLARLKPGLPAVAARFEFYIDGIELANGFHELANADEQRARFTHDLAGRRERAQVQPPLDERLLAALQAGMPDCAGVAMGFDRLVAVALGAERLSETMAFSIDNA